MAAAESTRADRVAKDEANAAPGNRLDGRLDSGRMDPRAASTGRGGVRALHPIVDCDRPVVCRTSRDAALPAMRSWFL